MKGSNNNSDYYHDNNEDNAARQSPNQIHRIASRYRKRASNVIMPSAAAIISLLLITQIVLGVSTPTTYYQENYVLDSGAVAKVQYVIDRASRQEINSMIDSAKLTMAQKGLGELLAGVLWKQPGSYEVVLTRAPTAAERDLILKIPWNLPVSIKVMETVPFYVSGNPCDLFTTPPQGVCMEYIRSDGSPWDKTGTLGFRARDASNPSITGAVSFNHGYTLTSNRVYHPGYSSTHIWWGDYNRGSCTNSNVDASFIVRRDGYSELQSEVLEIGPVFGTMHLQDVSVGLAVSTIGRTMQTKHTGYISGITSATSGCGSKTNQIVVTLYQSGAGPGDSGAPIGVDATVNGVQGVLRLSILWGGVNNDMYSSPWDYIEQQLNIQGY
ncbi:MAG: hypothetical protein HYY22_09390 [Thaumarchaeota archaeon]|nr:hypothetical protein [Nitrososphaerota archaeon]